MRYRPPLRSRGFTLIEILSVIAILAVLGYLGMGSLSRFLDSGRSAQSTSHMRQTAAAALVMAGDNNGIVDLHESDGGRYVPWMTLPYLLYSKGYVKDPKIFLSPQIDASVTKPLLERPSAAAWRWKTYGIESFSRTLATELAPHRITVNFIRPGATFTELTTPMYTDAVKRSLFERVPMKEIAEASWIADGALFLASEDSRYMTGQSLTIDGGYVMDGSLPSAEYCKE